MITFVTGGTGFIGIPTVRLLLNKGHQVRCLVRQTSRINWFQQMGIETIVVKDIAEAIVRAAEKKRKYRRKIPNWQRVPFFSRV